MSHSNINGQSSSSSSFQPHASSSSTSTSNNIYFNSYPINQEQAGTPDLDLTNAGYSDPSYYSIDIDQMPYRSAHYGFDNNVPYRTHSPDVRVPPIPVNIETTSYGGGGDNYGGGDAWSGTHPRYQPRQTESFRRDPDRDRSANSLSGWQSSAGSSSYDSTSTSKYRRPGEYSRSGWSEEFVSRMDADKVSRKDLEKEEILQKHLNQLELYLGEMINHLKFLATGLLEDTHIPRSRTHAQQRCERLSLLIAESLHKITPLSSSNLSSRFSKLPPERITPLTSAEKEMAMIRKRRDILIAKAAHLANTLTPPLYSGSPITSGTGPSLSNFRTSPPKLSPRGGQGIDKEVTTPISAWTNISSQAPMTNGSTTSGISLISGTTSTTTETHPTPRTIEPPYSASSLSGFGGLGAMSMSQLAGDPMWGPKCHGCGAGIDGEGMDGPDGPSSLCNTCGAHYAKLSRKSADFESTPQSQIIV